MSTGKERTEWTFAARDQLSGTLNRINERFENVDKTIDRVNRRMNKATGSANSASKLFAQLGSNVTNMAQSSIPALGGMTDGLVSMKTLGNPAIMAIVASIALITGGLIKAITAATEFNKEFRTLENINLDKTDAQLASLKETTLDLSYETGIASTSMSKAYFDLQSLTGEYGSKIEDTLKKVSKFSVAFRTDFNSSVEGGAKASRIFGYSIDQIDKHLENNLRTVQVAKTTFEELDKVQATFFNTAASAGQTEASADKLLAVYSIVEKNLDIAAERVKATFESLTDLNVQTALKRWKVDAFEANGSLKQIDQVVMALNDRLKGMDVKVFNRFKDDLGGTDGINSLLNSVRNNADGVMGTFKQFDQVNPQIDRAFSRANSEADVLWDKTKNKINVGFINLGNAILPTVAGALEWINTIIDGVNGKTENLGGAQSMIVLSLQSIGWVWSNLIVPPIKFVFNILDKIWWVVAKIGNFVKGVLTKAWEGVKFVLQPIFNMIEGIGNFIKNTFGKAAEFIGAAFNKVKGWISGLFTSIGNWWSDFRKGGQEAILKVGKHVADHIVKPFLRFGKEFLNQLGIKIPEAPKNPGLTKAIGAGAGINKIMKPFASGPQNAPSIPAAVTAAKGSAIDKKLNAAVAAAVPTEVSTGRSVKNITVNINKLVETVINNITNSGGKLDMNLVRQQVEEVLVRAIQDSEIAISNS